MNNLIEIYVNGTWDISHEVHAHAIIYDKGEVWLIEEDQYDQFIDELEETGFDCYLCLAKYKHPDWNGRVLFDLG